jgi:hypothetical protein
MDNGISNYHNNIIQYEIKSQSFAKIVLNSTPTCHPLIIIQVICSNSQVIYYPHHALLVILE